MSAAEESLSLLIGRSAKALSRAFDDVLTAAGGSTPTWQVLLALSTGEHRTQRDLARARGLGPAPPPPPARPAPGGTGPRPSAWASRPSSTTSTPWSAPAW